jgi:hypothetical protein
MKTYGYSEEILSEVSGHHSGNASGSGIEDQSVGVGFRIKSGAGFSSHESLPGLGQGVTDRREDFSLLIETHDTITRSGKPNFQDCRIPVVSDLNIPVWRSLLVNYYDNQLVDLLEFGFPVGYNLDQLPVSEIKNHSGATLHRDYVNSYISKEIQEGVMAGPFASNPLNCPLTISPLNSVPKKDPAERRVIADLSYPHLSSVNDGIPGDSYLGERTNLSFPTVDDLALRIRSIGPSACLFKKDLKRAYRQFRVDPGDIHLLGYFWQQALYIDMALVMGIRSAAYLCQRVTSAIGFMYEQMGYNLINYVDDLGVCVRQDQASQAYEALGNLLDKLGVKEAVDKACTPSKSMEFLGVLFDVSTMTMSVTPDRLVEIVTLIDQWLNKKKATKCQLQSLIGKLQFVAKCVRAGRVFISRLLQILPTLKCQHHKFYINKEIKKDLMWWRSFIYQFNGVTVIPDLIWSAPDTVFSTDACLKSMGGWSGKQYFSCMFPEDILEQQHDINVLELYTIVIAIKVWSDNLVEKRVQVLCDNMTSVTVINSGKCKDKMLLALLREIAYLCAHLNCQIKAIHIAGDLNRTSDVLSRAPIDDRSKQKMCSIIDNSWTEVKVQNNMFSLSNNW